MVRRILALGASLLVMAACSSTPDPTTAPAPTSSTAVAPVTTPPPATLLGPVTSASPDDPYCVALASMSSLDAVQQLAGAAPADIETAVDVATAAFGQVALVAPEQVRSDWATVGSVYAELFDAYRAAGFDLTALMSDPTSSGVFERFGAREVLDAGDRVEQHAEAACGVALGLGRSISADGPTPAATDTTAGDPFLTDEAATELGRQLLDEFGLAGTDEQAACFGRAISDPATVTSIDDGSGDALGPYRDLAAGCGIDTAAID